jgi:hypothetical protein
MLPYYEVSMTEEEKETIEKPKAVKKKYNKDGLIPGQQVKEDDYIKIINEQRRKKMAKKYAKPNSRIYQGWKRQQERKKRDFINFYPQDVPKDESDALIRFYKSGNGDNWNDNTGWLTDPVVGNWAGITVENGHVTGIFLINDVNVTTDIKHLKPLIKLHVIQLYGTGCYGDLSLITHFNEIERIHFGNLYGVHGDIIALKDKGQLQELFLNNTSVTGDIINLNSVNSLQVINFFNTNISGCINDIFNVSNITLFSVSSTDVTGDVKIIQRMPSLQGTGQYQGVRLEDTNISTYTQGTIPTLTANIDISNLGLSQTEIDNFLVDMDNSGSTNCPINVSGNSVPSQTGLDAIASLEGKGCTITYDTP